MSDIHPKRNALLVGIHLPRVSAEEFEGSLQELTRLVTTLGYNVVGRVTQKRSSDQSMTVLGEGKLKELARWTGGSGKIFSGVDHKLSKAAEKWRKEESADHEDSDNENFENEKNDTFGDEAQEPHGEMSTSVEENSADIVIVDTELSPSQTRNLESAAGVTVLDRTGVIIEIFSRHANTRAARLQVKIAQLTYLVPRLRETGGSSDRQGGGGKGAGESRLELDRRRVRDSIKALKEELASIGDKQDARRSRRDQEACVALVGYTNAGKSSLMRAMTGSEVLVADKLFATLDTTIRAMYPESQPKVLLSDTVGFIKKLPHDLVASFKSTLDEALNASLLLFVVDASDPSYKSQLEVTQSVLNEVGAGDIPKLIVLNKRDNLTPDQIKSLREEFPEAVMISTFNKSDLQMLRDKILSYFEEDMIDEDLFIPYSAQGVVGEVRGKMRVLNESYSEQGVTFKVRAPQALIASIKKRLDIA